MTKKETVLDPGRSDAVCRFEKIETPDKIKDRKKAPCVMGHEARFSLESEFQKGFKDLCISYGLSITQGGK